MKDLKKYLHNVELKSEGPVFGFGTSPEADWKAIFSGSLFLVLLAVAFGAYIFIMVDRGEMFGRELSEETSGRIFNAALLEEVVEYYTDKSKEFERVTNTRTTIADPSI